MNVLVTGAKGFIGKNMVVALRRRGDVSVTEYDLDSGEEVLAQGLAESDWIFHLAGVNRPSRDEEFEETNTGLTRKICGRLQGGGWAPVFVFSSSSQAARENPYGLSKRKAEEAIENWSQASGAGAAVFRLPGVFGKWSRPNYNSVVATFCYNLARDLPLSISDENKKLNLVYIDDVVAAFLDCLTHPPRRFERRSVVPEYEVTLGDLARLITSFRESRTTHTLGDFSDAFLKKLFGTYLSYLDTANFAYSLTVRSDARGELAEFIKQRQFGQIFVSRTKPGMTRGHHVHDCKAEKFFVLEGEALIRLRKIGEDDVLEYHIRGDMFRVLDIPPGYAHSITNVGQGELITLFWADELFDTAAPDTAGLAVDGERRKG